MLIFTWLAMTIAGLGITLVASRKAVKHASALAHGSSIPPFLIGITFVAIGTDLPEIANSVMASLAGHGDLNVGDSVGSVMTQITLVFGLLALLARGAFEVGLTRIVPVSVCTVIALGIGALLMADGDFSRLDAVVLLALWVLFTAVSWRFAPPLSGLVIETPTHHKARHAGLTMLFLALVGVGAGAAVKGIIELSALLGVPEYLISFFAVSIGTSLPELVVDLTAIIGGKLDLAIGDIVGSCLVDATLSIAIGPLIAPTAVTAAFAVRGAIIAMVVMALATAVVGFRRRHDRWSGVFLLLLYGAVYIVFIAT